MPPKRTPTARKSITPKSSVPIRLSTANVPEASSLAPPPAARRRSQAARERPVPVPTRQTRFERDGEEYVLLQEYSDGGLRVVPGANQRKIREYAERNAKRFGESEVGDGSEDGDKSGGEQSGEEDEEDDRVTGIPGSFLKAPHRKTTQPRIRWTAENDAKLLLFGLERIISRVDLDAIAASFPGPPLDCSPVSSEQPLTSDPESPTARAVENRFTKLRKIRDELLASTGIYTAPDQGTQAPGPAKKRARKSGGLAAAAEEEMEVQGPQVKKLRKEKASESRRSSLPALNTGVGASFGSAQSPPMDSGIAGPTSGFSGTGFSQYNSDQVVTNSFFAPGQTFGDVPMTQQVPGGYDGLPGSQQGRHRSAAEILDYSRLADSEDDAEAATDDDYL